MRKMMKTTTIGILAALAVAAIGCDDKKDATTPVTNTSGVVTTPASATPVTPAPSAIDPLANAENKDRVKQYADEVKMPPTPATLMTGTDSFVREATDGFATTETITTVPTGITVQEIARDKDYYLVLYPDAKHSGKQLAGWVYKDALEASTWPINAQGTTTTAPAGAPTAPKLTCKSSEKQLRAKQDFCARECKKDSDCTSAPGGLCDGVAFEVKKDGTASSKDAARYCVLNSNNVNRAPDMPMK